MLPKIMHPLFEIVIPSTKKKIKFRPMLVKEEKILLIAKEGDEDKDIFAAIKQVVNNCVETQNFDVDDLTLFDIEYIFLKIRSKSIDNIVELAYKDNEDGEIYKFTINLEEIEVKFPENQQLKLMINSDSGIMLKYPSATLLNDDTFFEETDVQNRLDYMIINCIATIFDSETVYKASQYSIEELKTFINELPIQTYNNINDFLTSMPTIYHELNYTNKNGKEVKIVLNTLNDFFMFR